MIDTTIDVAELTKTLSPPFEKVNILGTEWIIEYKDRETDEQIDNNDGYCNSSTKTIVVENMKQEKGSKRGLKAYTKQVVRHEIVYAFLRGSGMYLFFGQ